MWDAGTWLWGRAGVGPLAAGPRAACHSWLSQQFCPVLSNNRGPKSFLLNTHPICLVFATCKTEGL